MSSTARSPASTSTPDSRYAERGSGTVGRAHWFLEDELAARGVIWDGFGVVAVEAGEAEPLVRQVQRGQDATNGEVPQRVGADELADLGLGLGRGDELGLDRRIDPVEARVVDRRRADPDVDFLRSRLAQQLDDLLGR